MEVDWDGASVESDIRSVLERTILLSSTVSKVSLPWNPEHAVDSLGIIIEYDDIDIGAY